jgi:hypothetical protein
MGQPKSDEQTVHSPAARPSIGSAASHVPTIGSFALSMEAIRETAAVAARCPSVLDEIAESSDTLRTAPTRKRDHDHAAT